MKKLLFIACISVSFGYYEELQPPQGKIEIQSEHYCSRSLDQKNKNHIKHNPYQQNQIIEQQITNSRNYSFEELNNLITEL